MKYAYYKCDILGDIYREYDGVWEWYAGIWWPLDHKPADTESIYQVDESEIFLEMV